MEGRERVWGEEKEEGDGRIGSWCEEMAREIERGREEEKELGRREETKERGERGCEEEKGVGESIRKWKRVKGKIRFEEERRNDRHGKRGIRQEKKADESRMKTGRWQSKEREDSRDEGRKVMVRKMEGRERVWGEEKEEGDGRIGSWCEEMAREIERGREEEKELGRREETKERGERGCEEEKGVGESIRKWKRVKGKIRFEEERRNDRHGKRGIRQEKKADESRMK
ncbi:hypothetical protein RR48_00845 [Papilio machaon]|uniref:Uncharacterized protein n=1 Tax=Papilio machaon TaxID=76193 RepID=A0A0N1IG05_PAPMA|nr:hypothetical protein RR48_00845 [Papilio machaon]